MSNREPYRVGLGGPHDAGVYVPGEPGAGTRVGTLQYSAGKWGCDRLGHPARPFCENRYEHMGDAGAHLYEHWKAEWHADHDAEQAAQPCQLGRQGDVGSVVSDGCNASGIPTCAHPRARRKWRNTIWLCPKCECAWALRGGYGTAWNWVLVNIAQVVTRSS